MEKGRLAEGAGQLREALRLNPTNAETQFNLALALNQQQQWGEAAELFAKTVPAGSANPKAHYEFGVALQHGKKTRAALAQFAGALLLQPDYPDALNGLAWILSTDVNADFRNGEEAVKLASRACELTAQKDAEKLKTLAAALAEVGKFDEAQKNIRLALATAVEGEEKILCERMAESFAKSQPWRDQ